MKVIRRLARNGNSSTVSLPPQFLHYLRMRPSDPLVVEVTPRGSIEIRLAQLEDLRSSRVDAMTIDMAAPADASSRPHRGRRCARPRSG